MWFARQFDGMLASYVLGAVKPTTAFFAAAYNRLCHPAGISSGVGTDSPEVEEAKPYLIPKDQIFFWDDDPENVSSARSFGLRAEVYENLEQFKRVMATGA